jgi:hypothetical protein
MAMPSERILEFLLNKHGLFVSDYHVKRCVASKLATLAEHNVTDRKAFSSPFCRNQRIVLHRLPICDQITSITSNATPVKIKPNIFHATAEEWQLSQRNSYAPPRPCET